MGCHTWFYQKHNRTREKAKELALQKVEDNILFYDCEKNSDEDFALLLQICNDEKIKYGHKLWIRVKRMLEKDILNPYKFQPEYVTYWDEERGFFMEGDTHDVFRVYGYPEEKFFDYPTLKEWILNNMEKHSIQIDEVGWKKLEGYWKQYPESMICFG